MREKREKTSLAISEEAKSQLDEMSKVLHITKTSVLELAIRNYYEQSAWLKLIVKWAEENVDAQPKSKPGE